VVVVVAAVVVIVVGVILAAVAVVAAFVEGEVQERSTYFPRCVVTVRSRVCRCRRSLELTV
jgi:hypothetical protein